MMVIAADILKTLRGWGYYANYDKGRYINENDENYGPIVVHDALVTVNDTEAFRGDISENRLLHIRGLSKYDNATIRIYNELDKLIFEIRHGIIYKVTMKPYFLAVDEVDGRKAELGNLFE